MTPRERDDLHRRCMISGMDAEAADELVDEMAAEAEAAADALLARIMAASRRPEAGGDHRTVDLALFRTGGE